MTSPQSRSVTSRPLASRISVCSAFHCWRSLPPAAPRGSRCSRWSCEGSRPWACAGLGWDRCDAWAPRTLRSPCVDVAALASSLPTHDISGKLHFSKLILYVTLRYVEHWLCSGSRYHRAFLESTIRSSTFTSTRVLDYTGIFVVQQPTRSPPIVVGPDPPKRQVVSLANLVLLLKLSEL